MVGAVPETRAIPETQEVVPVAVVGAVEVGVETVTLTTAGACEVEKVSLGALAAAVDRQRLYGAVRASTLLTTPIQFREPPEVPGVRAFRGVQQGIPARLETQARLPQR